MTAFKGLIITSSVALAKPTEITVSGTVVDSGSNPLSREVLVYRKPQYDIPVRLLSSAVDGSWSTTFSGNANDLFIAIALGANETETNVISDWLMAE